MKLLILLTLLTLFSCAQVANEQFAAGFRNGCTYTIYSFSSDHLKESEWIKLLDAENEANLCEGYYWEIKAEGKR